MSKAKEKFVIIDGNALIHRAWHALPPTLQTKSGEIVNAVYGFTMILLKVLKDLKPEYLAVTFDLKAPTFRHQEYKEYKATRVKQADELYAQFPRIKEVVRAFNIPIYEKEGFEADDVIATLVKDKQVEKIKSIIVTGDLDTLQLVDENTEVYTMHKGIADSVTYDINQVKERFEGLTPKQMVDYKALRGDPSDNIPGVKGIGEKGAINLLKEFKTLENLYQNLDSKRISERYQKLLVENEKDALLSQRLCRLVEDVPIEFDLGEARVKGYDAAKVVPLFQALEFKSLISKLPKELQRGTVPGQGSFEFGETRARRRDSRIAPSGADMVNYQLIKTEADFKKFIAQLKAQKIFALDTETAGLNPLEDELLGISFCWQDGEAYYLPIPAGAIRESRLREIKPILADEKIKKIGHNIKYDIEVLKTAGVPVNGPYFDTMVAAYILDPISNKYSLKKTAKQFLGREMIKLVELIGEEAEHENFADVPLDVATDYACSDAEAT